MAAVQPVYRTVGNIGDMSYPPRYLTIDHWRGLAALMVVVHHAVMTSPGWSKSTASDEHSILVAIADRGWIGVPIFFAISGYCIAATADSSRNKWTGWASYTFRRVRRIFPPYWASLMLLLGLWLVPGVRTIFYTSELRVVSPRALNTAMWAGNIGLFEQTRASLVGQTRMLINSPAWSLCYEEQYYALIGLILIVARRWMFVGLIVLVIGVAVCQASGLPVMGTAADPYFYAFASGFAAYAACTRLGRVGRWLTAVVLLTVSGICGYFCSLDEVLGHYATPWNGGAIGSAFAAILIALRPLDNKLSSVPALRPLRWCGERCYSIYLMHWPLCAIAGAAVVPLGLRGEAGILFATIPACLLASVAGGTAFYWAVERHFLNRRVISPPGPHNSRTPFRSIPA